MKVLVVEDDPVARRQVEASLQRGGYDVVTASDGEQAWALLQQPDAPRLVVLDRVMPKMDGQELLRRLRADSARPYVYVILAAVGTPNERAATWIAIGADDQVRKPLDAADLRARVGNLARRLERELALERRIAELEAERGRRAA